MGLEAKAIEFTELAQLQLQTITDHIFKEFGEASTEKLLHTLERNCYLSPKGKLCTDTFPGGNKSDTSS